MPYLMQTNWYEPTEMDPCEYLLIRMQATQNTPLQFVDGVVDRAPCVLAVDLKPSFYIMIFEPNFYIMIINS